MRVLHYFLGFPPYRSGGLTKFCTDLIDSQAEQGNQVYALWPGRMTMPFGSVKIRTKAVSHCVYSCEIINPLPIPLDEGIWKTELFMEPCDVQVFVDFLEEIEPDVIHVHTLMGLYREFMEAAARLRIKTIFTTHDYFGICPLVTLYKHGLPCDDDNSCADCASCCQNALSLKKIMILQSVPYRVLKDSAIVRKLRSFHRNQYFLESDTSADGGSGASGVPEKSSEYQKLRAYYMEILRSMTLIHCNSSLAMQIYKRYLPDGNYKIITISNKEIQDHRQSEHHFEKDLRLTYLAPAKPFKGYKVLRQALDELWNKGYTNFRLHIFSDIQQPAPYMMVKPEGFQREELPEIMKKTDVLITPSVWYETFGFTVLESLSFGVPVVVSDHVGAKDIIGDGGIVVEAGSVEQLKKAIDSLTPDRILELRENIKRHINIKTWDKFMIEYNELLTSLGGDKENARDH